MRRKASTLHPTDTLSILTQETKPRSRKWEKENPALSFYLPVRLHERAVKLRQTIAAIAALEAAPIEQASHALLDYGIKCYTKGTLKLEARPNPKARKLNLVLQEVETWPRILEEVPVQPKSHGRRRWHPALSFRWPVAVRQQMNAIAEKHATTPGEVILRFLEHAAEHYKNGRVSFQKIQPVVENMIVGWEEQK